MPGRVYLVGSGPGDPGLLTLRAAELLARAPVIVHDALVNPAILGECPRDAVLHDVGKRAGLHSHSQGEINRLLVELAGRHDSVVRLKAGDPFVFGRGGEEALALVEAGVPFEVVPGVTAGVAAAAYAGIPVTHRGLAASATFLTGHEDAEKEGGELDWKALASGGGTLVFYMGVRRMQPNLERLIAAGLDPGTPAAVVERGTYPSQRVITATAADLARKAAEGGIEAPALVLVGGVVGLRERLSWIERRPLIGQRIVVTRARAQASVLAARLSELGAEVFQFPTIRIEDPLDPESLLHAVARVDTFSWVVFTSVNGVRRFWEALRAGGRDSRALCGVSVCAIGPATAAACELEGVRADLVPERFVAEAVLEAFAREGVQEGERVLIPRAAEARGELPEGLRRLGAEVTEVAAYRTVPDSGERDRLARLLEDGAVDWITFTASSTVRNFVEAVGSDLGGARVASIGPITSGTARELGLRVDIEAESYTIDGLVMALCQAAEGEA
jgi:uroporphyrinogen III methyltransferase / synthase